MHSNYSHLVNDMSALIEQLQSIAPRYHKLKARKDLSFKEKQELKDIEFFILEISPFLEKIKNVVNHDLSGMAVDYYYILKSKAQNGDVDAKKKLDKMRSGVENAISKSAYEHWN